MELQSRGRSALEITCVLFIFSGKMFSNKETFSQYPLQILGYHDLHASIEASTSHREIETVRNDSTCKSAQEVSVGFSFVYKTLKLCLNSVSLYILLIVERGAIEMVNFEIFHPVYCELIIKHQEYSFTTIDFIHFIYFSNFRSA